ncbi:hypothetical protein HU200_055135 [Digitaria exilis]|uniref:Serpin domain-containing protein n=1 Tax=Digitaria exilis TaxID=1010633 RepID=A0A835ATN1_9POAL|nr:hypothetical protein HU200_055135 [Digitaria exilis]CAB3478402.1 unnamed protein product [Digitaria exilis]
MEHADAARDEAAFSMRVLHHMSSRGDGLSSVTANLAVSPLSLHAALVLLGASARGATLDQIIAFLGPAGAHAHALLASHVALRVLAADAGDGPTVRFANGVWIDAALRLTDAYAHQVTEHYLAEVRSVPFKSQPEEATRQMNEWIEAATAGRIKNPIPAGSITTSTQAVLTNELYFNGAWSHKFEIRYTQHHAFYLLNGSHVLVPFMSNTKNQYIARRCGYKVLRLPYDARSTATPGSSQHQQRVFSMYIYLPDDYYGLPSLLRNLSSNPSLLESSGTMRNKVPMGAFMVPKFTVSCGTDATETLQALGLKLPFDPVAADLSEMVEAPPEPLVVSKVHHMCFVEVNEEGTEAAAATFFNPVPGCPPMMPVDDFVANHPFIFLIKEDRSGVVVFAGQVTNPSLLA